jgi:hypothetical protein
MHLSEFYRIYSGLFVIEQAVEKIHSQVRLIHSTTVTVPCKKTVTLLLDDCYS